MAKINFGKSEKSIHEAQQQWLKKDLLRQADAADAKRQSDKDLEKESEKEKKADTGVLIEGSLEGLGDKAATVGDVVNRMKQDLLTLNGKSKTELLARLGLKKSELQQYIDDPSSVNREQFEKIKEIQDRIASFSHTDEAESEYNKSLIDHAREESGQINVKYGWRQI